MTESKIQNFETTPKSDPHDSVSVIPTSLTSQGRWWTARASSTRSASLAAWPTQSSHWTGRPHSPSTNTSACSPNPPTRLEMDIYLPFKGFLFNGVVCKNAVFADPWHLVQIRILGFVPLTNRSGSGSNPAFLSVIFKMQTQDFFFSLSLKGTLHKTAKIKGFLTIFGPLGFESEPLAYGFGSGWPTNIRIRIRNTVKKVSKDTVFSDPKIQSCRFRSHLFTANCWGERIMCSPVTNLVRQLCYYYLLPVWPKQVVSWSMLDPDPKIRIQTVSRSQGADPIPPPSSTCSDGR